jgi:hypothetical protein
MQTLSIRIFRSEQNWRSHFETQMFQFYISRYRINADKLSIYDKTEFEEIGAASVDKKKRDFICERTFCSLLKIRIESVVGRIYF